MACLKRKNKYIPALVILIIIISVSFLYIFGTMGTMKNTDQKISSSENVILVHGILRGSSSMAGIKKELINQGFNVIDFDYSVKEGSIREISDRLNDTAKKIHKGKIYFVTHSLGGIIVRYYIFKYKPDNIGRVVMIAPPNSCSSFAAKLSNLPLYENIFGLLGQEIAKGQDCIINNLPEPDYECGIIAGGTGFQIGFNPFLEGDNDGTVLLEETKLNGMKDFIQIKGQHSLLLLDKEVVSESIDFIKNGKFQKKAQHIKK